jgi:hypothetical protein
MNSILNIFFALPSCRTSALRVADLPNLYMRG